MAPTDEELLELMPQGFRDDLALVSRMAAHGAGPEVQPGLFRVSLNTGALGYARAVWDRARAALAEPEPEAAGPTRLRTERRTGPFGEWTALIPCNSPAPAPAGEVADETRYLTKELRDQADDLSPSLELFGLIHRAADLLEQHHPAPVPVSERLPELGDCDGEHYCWRWNTIGGLWARQPLARSWYEFESHWLPAHALPLPSGEVE